MNLALAGSMADACTEERQMNYNNFVIAKQYRNGGEQGIFCIHQLSTKG